MRPYLRVANVYEDRIDLSDVMEMHFEPEEVERYELKVGDILLNEGQSRELVGRPAMYRGELPKACFTNSLVRFQASEVVERKYALDLFRHWLKSGFFQSIAQITTNIAHLGAGRFGQLDFPLPPLNEQRRIVAKLEALQARSRRAREALDAVPPLLEKLRQSILAAAFRGDLTKDWRANHKHVEPATKLLERIRVVRRTQWEEAELAKMKAKGKAPTDDKWKTKYKKPEALNVTGLPKLPEGWCWASLDELTWAMTSGSRAWSQYYGRGSGTFVMAQNVRPWMPDFRDRQPVDPPARDPERARTLVRAGDLLVTIVGANTGDVCLVTEELKEHYVCQSVALLRPTLSELAWHLLAYLNARAGGGGQLETLAYGQGRPHLGFEHLRAVAVPVPPLTETVELRRRLEDTLAALEPMRLGVAGLLERLPQLDSAILAKAFCGELVRQDPNDEPAETMIARLRETNGSASSADRRKKAAARPRARDGVIRGSGGR